MTTSSGTPVAGQMSADKTSWAPTAQLDRATTYKIAVKAKDSAGREFSATMNELAEWQGNRGDAGRLPPKGFPKSNKFGRVIE